MLSIASWSFNIGERRMSDIVELDRNRLIEVFEKQARKLLEIRYELKAGEGSGAFLKRLSHWAKFLHSSDALMMMTFHKGHVPCLLVIPNQVVPWTLQLKDLRAGPLDELSLPGGCDSEVRAYYKPPTWAPPDIYLIFDVDPGDNGDSDVDGAGSRFNKADRRGLTVEEGISLAAYMPELLEESNLYLLGCPPVPSRKVMSMRADKGVYLRYVNGVKSGTFNIPSTPKLVL